MPCSLASWTERLATEVRESTEDGNVKDGNMGEIRTWDVTPHDTGRTVGLTISDPEGEWLPGVRGPDGGTFVNRGRKLLVIVSAALAADLNIWIHLSVSRSDGKLPEYTDMMHARDVFLGDVECYQIHPPKERHVNIHPGVLHLFTSWDNPKGVLPRMEGKHPAVKGNSL